MKKTLWIVMGYLIFIASATCSQALEVVSVIGFDSTWVINAPGAGTGTVTTNGATVNLSAIGSAANSVLNTLAENGTTGVVGMMATLKVNQATSTSGNASRIGISQNIGMVGTNTIQILMALNQKNGSNMIWYRVRFTDAATNIPTVLAQGTFGDTSGGWSNGDNRTVAFALIGNELWFYSVEVPEFIKVQLPDAITKSNNDSPTVFAYADQGTGNAISGSVSNIYLIKQ